MKPVVVGVFVASLAVPILLAVSPARAQDRVLRKEVVVDASLKEVWDAFTTSQGAETFFARKAKINPILGGSYELYFHPDRPHGKRGCEDVCHIQSIVPMRSLAFTWNVEPSTKTLHAAGLTTIVSLHFEEMSSHRTRVHFSNVGWGEGAEWDESYRAFDNDWNVVLGRLRMRFASGPIDWANPPNPSESLAVSN